MSPAPFSQVMSAFQAKFTKDEKPFEGITHPVWSGGSGKPIILMHELDGFSPAFMQLAIRLSDTFTVHTPVFYGEVGETVGMLSAYFCMRQEFEVFRLGKTSPITNWIRALAADIYHQAGRRSSVGVVGMCMTGGIVLATISHPSVGAGVAAQPSLPFAIIGSQQRKEDLGMHPDELKTAAHSVTPVLTLRYGKDFICPKERIDSITRQIQSAEDSPTFLKNESSHPTLTDFFRPNRGQHIRDISNQAIEYTIEFLSKHLK